MTRNKKRSVRLNKAYARHHAEEIRYDVTHGRHRYGDVLALRNFPRAIAAHIESFGKVVFRDRSYGCGLTTTRIEGCAPDCWVIELHNNNRQPEHVDEWRKYWDDFDRREREESQWEI